MDEKGAVDVLRDYYSKRMNLKLEPIVDELLPIGIIHYMDYNYDNEK